ncbi:DNA replication/repair protein RecF [Irregularibacter muris]|uniref:DNA replication and repair protein RecF n=1 Tax=Irregularibacter muris TaxID=1796619 RepID=A0AAE3HES0_9FIRM|nr:DNA replication/repair protein RecF [Irregularibacter muris]MCR1899241.1 DNA replication/repair protein RecF [Irregularibacter muris]
MYIEELHLKNYRNYNQLDLKLHPKINIFVGNNAQGKTNIIESIYLMSIGKSHRSSKDKEIIAWGQDHAFLMGKFNTTQGQKTIEIGLSHQRKKLIKRNGIVLEKIGELLGQVNTVLFSPEDLRLIKEGPVERRNFLDREISNLRPQYYYALLEYNKILQQRNHLLKKIKIQPSLRDTLPLWNEQLINMGSKIIQMRLHFLKKINVFTKSLHHEITDGFEKIELFYQSTLISSLEEMQQIKELFGKELKKSENNDIKKGTTTIGPHRDDIKINVNKIDIRSFGSQGQQRTAALSLKLSLIQLIYTETGEFPILLLDDVMSELDQKRQKKLIHSLQEVQTFITCTDLSFLEDIELKEKKIFEIQEGRAK